MEEPDLKECDMNGELFPNGSQVCSRGKCLVCVDGEWIDTDNKLACPKE